MNGRARVTNTLERKEIDRIPRYDAFWEDTLASWRLQGFPEDADPQTFFDWDIEMMHVDLSMRQQQKLIEDDGEYLTVQDRFGYTLRKPAGKSRTFEILDHVTKDRTMWEKVKPRFTFSADDRARLDTAPYFLHMDPYPTWEEAKAKYDEMRTRGKYLLCAAYGPWEGTWRHRGFANLMMDLAESPDWVHEMGDALMDLLINIMRHALKSDMKPDGIFLIDDLACNKGVLLSPDSWRTIYKPLYARLGEFLHENGMTFWLHCCGNCGVLIEDFIDAGLDVLQPLQAHAGMDVRELKPRYGDRLALWGNIDVRQMSGSAEECEAEVREKVTLAKEGGGYLYHSDHSIPPEVTYHRYQWIMDLLEKYGRYDRK